MGTTTHFDPEVTVALQGTLDTFALPDVLRLLAATKKSGRLRITGVRGAGSLWVTGGEVCATEATHAPHATSAIDALFELLRFEEGSFAFEADVVADSPGPLTDVEVLLEQAETLLADWRQIEAVVPSLDAFVTLRRTLEAPPVTISQDHWTTLVAVGGGATVRAVADALSLPEIPVSRAVRDLAELGVIDIATAAPTPARTPTPSVSAPLPDAPPEAPPVAVEDEREAEAVTEQVAEVVAEPVVEPVVEQAPIPEAPGGDPDALPTARPLRARRSKAQAPVDDGPREPERFVPLELPGHMASSPATEMAAQEPDAEDGDTELAVDDLAAAFPGLANRSTPLSPEDEELARQLATLSPRAADAVRAAAEAGTDEERDAALAEAEASEEDAPINRGLLLKFLSSVKS